MPLPIKQSFETFSDFKAQLHQVLMSQVPWGIPEKKRRRVGDRSSGTPIVGGETASSAPPQYSTCHKAGYYARTCR